MISYKLEYMKCDEEREKLKKQIEYFRKNLDDAYSELRECIKKEEREEILRRVEEISKVKAEEILKSEEFKEKMFLLIENIIENTFSELADVYAERLTQVITETIEEEISKILERRINNIKEIIKKKLEYAIYDMTV